MCECVYVSVCWGGLFTCSPAGGFSGLGYTGVGAGVGTGVEVGLGTFKALVGR